MAIIGIKNIQTYKPWNNSNGYFLLLFLLSLLFISIQSIYCFSIVNPSSDSEIVIVDGRNTAQSKSSQSLSSSSSLVTTIATTILSSNQPNYNYYITGNHNHPHNRNVNNGQQHIVNDDDNNNGEHHELPPKRFQVAKFDFEHGMFVFF